MDRWNESTWQNLLIGWVKRALSPAIWTFIFGWIPADSTYFMKGAFALQTYFNHEQAWSFFFLWCTVQFWGATVWYALYKLPISFYLFLLAFKFAHNKFSEFAVLSVNLPVYHWQICIGYMSGQWSCFCFYKLLRQLSKVGQNQRIKKTSYYIFFC